MAHMKTGPKVLLIVLFVGSGLWGLKSAAERGWLGHGSFVQSIVPQRIQLPELADTGGALAKAGTPVTLPSTGLAHVPNTLIRAEVWEWNAQANMILANGGAETTKGSLMEKHHVNLLITRQDDTPQMAADLVACANEIHNHAESCEKGANFVIIMGDQAGGFLAGLNAQLKKIGDIAKAYAATGYSRGEDGFWATLEVRENPKAARGLLISGAIPEGDWDVALKWAGDNGIKNNPDVKTYDPDAMNWVRSDNNLTAVEDYVANKCEDRKVVKDGVPTGETRHVCVNAVVTWTPGDVNIVEKRGGLVPIVTTRQYRSQMPATIIAPANFFNKNRDEVAGMIAAILEAGDQMRDDKAIHKAAALSAKVYNDQDEAYWYKYFKGTKGKDSQGNVVELGGSAVNNLEDEKILFGLKEGYNDNFKATYTLFAGIVMQQYPLQFKDTPIPPASEIEDRSFIRQAEDMMNGPGAEADVPNYAAEANAPVVSQRSWEINFDTNQATFTPAGEAMMHELKNQLAITGMYIRVDGYTDNAGDDRINLPLSVRRAQAVKTWLQTKAPANFPDSRFQVNGHGSQRPVDTNATPEGRAHNRRVDITLSGS